MAEIDPQTVARITQAVIEALQNGQTPAAGGGSTQPAPIHPPIGVCTGDYSQYADRPDLAAASPAAPNPPVVTPGDAAPPVAPAVPALTGIITAQQLQEAIAISPDAVATLAHDARLTPLANDHVREHPECIRRVEAPRQAVGITAGPTWLWWAEGHCPAVVATAAQLQGTLVPSASPRSEAGLIQAIRDTALGVRNRTLAGGVLYVRSAARASVLANRCASLRAIVGTCPDAVEEGIRTIGANLLIIEYPYTNSDRIVAMTTRITQSRPAVPAHVARELNELHRLG